MSNNKVSKRYAKAIFEESEKKDSLKEIAKEFEAINQVLNASPDLIQALSNPVIDSTQKLAVLKKIFPSVHPDISRLFEIVSEKRRENILQHIAQSFLNMHDEKLGLKRVAIQTTVPLQSEVEHRISDWIKSKTGANTVLIDNKVNKDIIGGMVIRFGDNLIDSSIKSQINKLKKEFNIA